MFKPIVLGLMVLCCVTVQAQQQPAQTPSQRVFKWTDDEGKIQYSEVPPPNRAFEVLHRPAPASQTPPAAPATAAPPPAQDQPAEAARQDTDPQRQQGQQSPLSEERQQQFAKNCEIAKTNVKALKGDQPVVRQDAEGKRVLLSNEERATALKQAEKDEQYFCNP